MTRTPESSSTAPALARLAPAGPTLAGPTLAGPILAGLVLAALASGCAASPSRPAPADLAPSASAPASSSPSRPAEGGGGAGGEGRARTPREIVSDRHARLLDARVERHGGRLTVAAWWGCVEHGCGHRRAIATSADGFRTGRYLRWTRAAQERYLPRPSPAPASSTGLEGLLTELAPSSGTGTTGVVAGGDGATLLPFQRTARSTDRGRTWTTFDVATRGGVRAYVSGAVVTGDGRLLALLDHWSDDRGHHPSDRPHGLYASDGDDWSSYAPLASGFRPRLAAAPYGWSPVVSVAASPGVVWVTTWDSRLYVTVDDGATFEQVRAR